MGRAGSSTQRDRKVQPPRPPNAWILYRSHQFKQIRETNGRLSQATVSKLISDMWKNETEDVKRHFEQEAERRKAQHQELYPDYRFCPKRKEAKQSRKKSKCHDATPSDMDDDENDDADAPLPVPALPLMPYAHPPQSQVQPLVGPGYHHSVIMPQSFMIPYLPEAHFGPGGPSPPMSAAPSPARHQASVSPLQSSVALSSSSHSTRPSSSSQSQVSYSSTQLPANSTHLPSLPDSHHQSPSPYATQPLSIPLYQDLACGELPLTSQLSSVESAVNPPVALWNFGYLPIPDSQRSKEVVHLDVAISQPQDSTESPQEILLSSSLNPLQGLLSSTDDGVFNLSNVESSELLDHPGGDLEVALGQETSTIIEYNDELFAEFDFVEFQRQMDTLRGSPTLVPSSSVEEDLQSLFRTPDNPELQAYTAARQRQPSTFTQDMMDFLNFEAAEDSNTVGSPIATTATPQQVRLESPQVVTTMPIFTQMTNTPISGTSYVPPAGAIYSSNRRVAGTWKPPFAVPRPQMEELLPSWTL